MFTNDSILSEALEQHEYTSNLLKLNPSLKLLAKQQWGEYKARKKSTIGGFLELMLYGVKHRAKNRELDYDLTIKFVLNLYKKQAGKCALSNIRMTFINAKPDTRISNTNISIDRIDSSKGYTKDNIQLVCAIVNIMKLDHKTVDFLSIVKEVYNANFK